MALQKLSPGMELDLLTKDELEEVMVGVVSGSLRPPRRIREPSGVTLDSSGNCAASTVYRMLYRIGRRRARRSMI